MSIVKFLDNDEGVSPIVATLVLIVVAIIGASAVGLIMGSFSTQVSDEMNTGDVSGSASTKLSVSGSTTIQPVSELLAKAYMDENPGVKISVAGGGSGAGISATELGITDIGMASEAIDADDHPTLNVYKIGGSGVVFITNGADETTMTKAELQDAFDASATTTTTYTVYTRSEKSGTADTADGYLIESGVYVKGDIYKTADGADTIKQTATSNQDMLNKIEGDIGEAIGFVDYGFAAASTGVDMVTITDGTNTYNPEASGVILNALKGDYAGYPEKLVRPLNFMTLNAPSALEQAFIDFCRSPAAQSAFDECGYFSAINIGA